MGAKLALKAMLFSQVFAPLACIASAANASSGLPVVLVFWWQLQHHGNSLVFADFPSVLTCDLNIVDDVVWCRPLHCKPCCHLMHPNHETASL
jgi:hypothetical protein